MSTKNAYEIRLAILEMAHGDEMTKFHEKLNLLRCEDENQIEGRKMLNETEIDGLFPRTENVLKRAEELYAFVNA